MNVQRLLKFPKVSKMGAKEKVNHKHRRRVYEARDKEELISLMI